MWIARGFSSISTSCPEESERQVRLKALEAARAFVESVFPACNAALLAGSASRGEETATSDLDIVVFVGEGASADYRESFERFGWKIETFIHDKDSYLLQFEKDRKKGRPVLASMIQEGVVLADTGIAAGFKEDASQSIAQGPEPLTDEFIQASRYFMFDFLDDFKDGRDEDETIMTLNSMCVTLADFVLRLNGQWTGRGKTLTRALYDYDPALAKRLFQAMDAYYRNRQKGPLVQFVHEIYAPLGGPIFNGFAMGKPKLE